MAFRRLLKQEGPLSLRAIDSPASARPRIDIKGMSAMKQVLLATLQLAILTGIVSAPTQSRQRPSSEQSVSNESAVRSRVVGPRVANHAEKAPSAPVVVADASASRAQPEPAWGNTPITSRSQPPVGEVTPNKSSSADEASLNQTVVQSTILPLTLPAATNVSPAGTGSTATPSVYAVGVGDVLDIRLSNTPARESTLFTVLKNGTIEYPLILTPVPVLGMGTDEIAR